jgi:Fic-DOC domain mobile mystery protein B
VTAEPEGATPLTEDESHGLLASFVATREDLNVVEQAGIAAARTWVLRSRTARGVEQVLDELFVRRLHARMFGQIWGWAGTYRTTERNIGIDPTSISVAVRTLVDDARLWVAPGTTWITPERACMKVHHTMVSIHPFPNGNGRHARLFCDVLARSLGMSPFTWGGGDLNVGP